MSGTATRDLGLEAVEQVYRDMQIDDEWSVREERGFTWWGAWLRQRVWAGEADAVGRRDDLARPRPHARLP